MPSSAAISVRLIGLEKTLAVLGSMPGRVDEAQWKGLSEAAVYVRGRVMRNLAGRGDFPQWRTGRLARGTLSEMARRAGPGWISRVGTAATVPYGPILEFGGPVPECEIFAGIYSGRSNKRALAWPASSYARMVFASHLGARATPKQAQKRTIRATRGSSGFAFAAYVVRRARYQRAIPYLGPTMQEELPKVTQILRAQLAAAIRRT